MTETIRGAEFVVNGLTFIVDYRYYRGLPADDLNPADPDEVDIFDVEVLGQPQACADEVLEAMRSCRGRDLDGLIYTNGYDELERLILEVHQQ